MELALCAKAGLGMIKIKRLFHIAQNSTASEVEPCQRMQFTVLPRT